VKMHIVPPTGYPPFDVWYKGGRGEEYMVMKEWSDAPGVIHHYEGTTSGKEILTRTIYPNGTVLHYQGPAGSEKVAWEETPDGKWIERP